MSVWGAIAGQFKRLPYPDEDYTGRTVIVTGANVGLGLEAARHFVRLQAARVILGCRDADKGEAARRDVEASTGRAGVVDVWPLDLSSFDSVLAFADRAAGLERLDVLVNNASVLVWDWTLSEGHETMVTVNVLSTFLLTVLLLPALRRAGRRFNALPRVVVVSSDGAFLTHFPERSAPDGGILARLRDPAAARMSERYNTTKLLQLAALRALAEVLDGSAARRGRVVVTGLNPGFCRTDLFRALPFPLSLLRVPLLALFARDAEAGARTLLAAAAVAPDEGHGRWMTDAALRDEWPAGVGGDEGARLARRLWGEMAELFERVRPGVMEEV